ncbi:hypothetical protein [Amycolatopsis sp. NPDC001319]|uniref:hypothetical protein n=1 Tax=unclassified Amycolatopsis TaxID=2618356 RepID=UPI00368B6375
MRRAGIVLASVQGRSAGEIAMMFAASENYVWEVIHAFNAQGFAALAQNGAAADRLNSVRPSAS